MVRALSQNRILERTEHMDRSRGFISAAAGSMLGARPPQEGAIPGTPHSNPAGAGTRLHPANATQQDFFASKGSNSSSRSCTGGSASTISTRRSSFTNTRPASTTGTDSFMSTSSGWMPPSIGELGSKRSTQPSLQPTVGPLSSSCDKTITTTLATCHSTTKRSNEGLDKEEAATTVSAPSTVACSAQLIATSIPLNPTELFSMEDAEELYSDDQWNCDSPSTVLSYPMEDTATKTTTAAAGRSKEIFESGDDDDAIASPVHPPLLNFCSTIATKEPATRTIEPNVESLDPPQSVPPLTALSSTLESSRSQLEIERSDAAPITSQNMVHIEHNHLLSSPDEASPSGHRSLHSKRLHSMDVPHEETQSIFERSHAQAASSLPGATSSSFMSIESAHDAFVKSSVTTDEGLTHEAPHVATSTDSHQNVERYYRSKLSVGQGRPNAIETMECSTTTSTPTMMTPHLDAFVVPPNGLASPGGAAGEFWGGGDEKELFDNDDNADEKWDESSPLVTKASREDSGGSTLFSHEASFPLLSQPLPLQFFPDTESIIKQEPKNKETEVANSLVGSDYQEMAKGVGQEKMIATNPQETVAVPPVAQSTVQQPPEQAHDVKKQLKETTAAMLVTESPPYSSIIAESESRDNNTHVFPEAPHTAHFLHTPTGTGDPFGRVPSPHGNDDINFHDELSGSAVPTARNAHHTSHTSMTFYSGEEADDSDAYTESSVRCNIETSPSGGLGQMSSEEQAYQRNVNVHPSSRQGQNDEEERDSLVSLSGEHSFFSSAERPSSVYGTSQSSFASHHMYPSSVASTDHDGSSIASFGVSSARATVGGSERASEGGAFSDGTMSETPSMVNSSNASTAFGVDFVSVSEEQFSAPGTTIGGSDNASDGEFSDGNASEIASLCESVNTRSPSVSEYSALNCHYSTIGVECHALQENVTSSAPVSGAVASSVEFTTATASLLFASGGTSVDEKPFASSPSSSQHTTSSLSASKLANSTFARNSESTPKVTIQSAAMLFGATAGTDVPNPFCSFDASPSMPVKTKSVDAHKLPSLNAEDLFGGGPSMSGFETLFAPPVNHASSSSYYPHDQTFGQPERRDPSDSHATVFASGHNQFPSFSSLDRPAAANSILSPSDSYNYHNCNSVDPFATQSRTQYGSGSLVPLAGSSGEDLNGDAGIGQSVSSHLGKNVQTSADAVPGGYSQMDDSVFIAAGHSGQPCAVRVANQDNTYNAQTFSDQTPAFGAADDYQSLRLSQGSPGNNSHQSAADVFGFVNQRSQYHTHSRYDKNASREAGNHLRSSLKASEDAFVGQSSAPTGRLSSSSDLNEERIITAPTNDYQQQSAQTHPRRSLIRSASSASFNGEQHGDYALTMATTKRRVVQSHDVNQLCVSAETTSFSRNASSSSLNAYGGNASYEPRQHMQQPRKNTPAHPSINAKSLFGVSSATTAVTASTFFGSSASRDLSETQTLQHSEPKYSNTPYGQTNHDSALLQQQDKEEQQRYLKSKTKTDVGAALTPTLALDSGATPMTTIKPTSLGHMRQRESLNGNECSSAAVFIVQQEANDRGVVRPKTVDGIADSGLQGSGEHHSSEFVSFSSAPPTHVETSSYQSEQKEHWNHHELELMQSHGATAAPLQLAKTPFTKPHTIAYGGSSVHASAAHLEKHSSPDAHEAGAPDFAYHRAPQHEHYPQHQHRSQDHAATDNGYYGGLKTLTAHCHPYGLHGYGSAAKYGKGLISEPPISHSSPAPVVMISNKYKDPCIAPPSCLASFGFGGNVVTMFPQRKPRQNIPENSFRGSPRGAPLLSDFENSEVRNGPVHLYRMDQYHPKDKGFLQMDDFPGPLTESVSDETILEYIDDRLKYIDAPECAAEAGDENDRLLLGVLRILVKCNGKLRSEPGTLKPDDPDSPEAQLITLLSECCKRHSRNQSPSFPAPRFAQSILHPNLMLNHVNKLRELLFVGDRKGAVTTAISAHMWPEAMLIASFTDKEEYRKVLRIYLDETYAIGDPSRALFMSFADQQEKSVHEPKRLLQTNAQQPTGSLVLSAWVSHAQVLLANRTADTNKILTELGDRLWNEANVVTAAHVCYLLAGIQVDAPLATSKIALLGGDHRTPTEARFYVSPSAVQLTEIYEWAHKYSMSTSANLMIPFQGYKLIYAMLLADHGKIETAFKYVTSMLLVIKAVTATMRPGTSIYLDGIQNQLIVLDDRLRQHLGQDRVAFVTASTSGGEGSKRGKWGIGSALSIMGKIVNRVVEGNDSNTALSGSSATSPMGLFANEATPSAASYPSTTSAVTGPTLSSIPLRMQNHAQQSPSLEFIESATPPVSQASAPGSSSGYNRNTTAPRAKAYPRPSPSETPQSGPFSGNGCPGLNQQQSSGPFSGNGRSTSAEQLLYDGPGPFLRSQHSVEPPGSNRSTHSNSSVKITSSTPTPINGPQSQFQHAPPYLLQHEPPSTPPPQQPLLSQTVKHLQDLQLQQDSHTSNPAFQKPAPLDLSGSKGASSQPKTLPAGLVAEETASLLPPDAATLSGPPSDKGKASTKLKNSARSKTPPPSGSSKGSSWLSGLSSFIATKMNPEAKVAKLGEQMEAYFDEEKKCWVFPGETSAEEPTMSCAPPTGPLPGSAPGSSATGLPPMGTNSAPGSMSSGPAPSGDPLVALMAPPPSRRLMTKDPLAAMMTPPSRPGLYGARGSTPQRKPPRPQFAVFKPRAATATAPKE